MSISFSVRPGRDFPEGLDNSGEIWFNFKYHRYTGDGTMKRLNELS